MKRLSALMDILTKYRFDVRSFMLNKELSEKERKQKVMNWGGGWWLVLSCFCFVFCFALF